VVDEQHAFEMVHLMLQAHREQPLELLLMAYALLIEPAGADAVGAIDVGILVGHRQAALTVGHFVVGLGQYLGIDEDARFLDHFPAFLGRLAKVHHQQPLGHADLDRGKPDPRRVVHRVEHVGDQHAQFVVDRLDRGRDLPQHGVGRFEDAKNGHGRELVMSARDFNPGGAYETGRRARRACASVPSSR